MRYLLLIPAAFAGVMIGWLVFAAIPGVVVDILLPNNNHSFMFWYIDAAAPYAGVAGAIIFAGFILYVIL